MRLARLLRQPSDLRSCVEHDDADAVGGEGVAVGVGKTADEPGQVQSAFR
jgi:hypothetical protein